MGLLPPLQGQAVNGFGGIGKCLCNDERVAPSDVVDGAVLPPRPIVIVRGVAVSTACLFWHFDFLHGLEPWLRDGTLKGRTTFAMAAKFDHRLVANC